MLWSFSRDKGTPFHENLIKVQISNLFLLYLLLHFTRRISSFASFYCGGVSPEACIIHHPTLCTIQQNYIGDPGGFQNHGERSTTYMHASIFLSCSFGRSGRL
jgi:hypothetical protein